MAKFTIQPHGRLQEWIAHEKGYFLDAGLNYEFRGGLSVECKKEVDATGKIVDVFSGAFESYEQGKGNKGIKSDISCACHWAVNQASSPADRKDVGQILRGHAGRRHGAAGVANPRTGGFGRTRRGSRLSFRQPFQHAAGARVVPRSRADQVKVRRSSWARVDAGVEGDVPATSVWGTTYQVLEQLGFRKIVDTTFMIAFLFPHGVDPADVDKYMECLKRAQMDLDFAPERYKHFYLEEIPERYKSRIDVRRFSTGERIVFLPYGTEAYAKTQAWIREHGLFGEQRPAVDYATAVAV
jgi:hypothetical protein